MKLKKIIVIVLCSLLMVGCNNQTTKKTTTYTPTLKHFLKTSIKPVGQTMYVWGGGWNKADTAAGKEARQMGLSPRWKAFYQKQNANYDVSQTAYQIHDGLDCSGFVGWVTYNTMETKDGQPGYVKESGKQIQWFAKKGFGKVIQADAITTYHPGDLMANQDHIFIVLGQYKDGSLLIVHASVPGVQISGTPDINGNINSLAIQKATALMEKHYPEWCAKYPNHMVDYSYLTDYDQFVWNTKTFKDAKKIQKMKPSQILSFIY
ncbi:MAG: hypothetical protein UHB90_03630 [Absicoccus porci]|jgi:hypothetical protein|uniref:hypothetical protein n=1 Tax=Absicoccus porci TaxID=2486576 RepID=UPI002E77AEE7|nr:hypothetical protein [Absicoccus porci]MEE1354793.1 hypothetical protein [Absicoccus porci]